MFNERNNNNSKVLDRNKPNRYTEPYYRFNFKTNDWILFVPLFLAAVCYVNGLYGDFVHDDVFAIKNNKDVLGRSSLSEVWKNDFWGKPMVDKNSHKSYRPLTVLTFRWNYQTTGDNPFYFHAVNIVLHVAVTFLFVITCKDVFRLSRTCRVVAGTLFAVHPIHTEAVTGIVGRADVLSAVFFLAAFLGYVKSISSSPDEFPEVQHPGRLVASLLLAAAAMLCKETGITVLGVCLLYDVGVVCRRGVTRLLNGTNPCRPNCGPLVKRAVTLVSTGLLLLSIRLWIMGGTMPVFAHSDNPASFHTSPITRYLSYSYVWAYNCWLLVMPYSLCYDWQNGSIPLVESFGDIRNLATISFFIALAFILYKCLYALKTYSDSLTAEHLLLSLVFTIVPFLPASNMFLRVGFVLAERVLYIPSMGFCILFASGYQKLLEKWPEKRTVTTVMFVFLIAMHTGKTWQRNEVWLSREALFRSGVNTIPHNSKVHYNYANFLKDLGRNAEAIKHYRETIRLKPDYASAYNNMGTLLADTEEKLWHYNKALDILPNHVGAHVNIGSLYMREGNTSESLRYLYLAIELDSSNTDAQMALAWTLMETGTPEKAEVYLRAVLDAHPGHVQALVQYGELMKRLDRHSEAVQYYQAAYALDMTENSALVMAAQSLNKLGNRPQAEDFLKRAIEIKRDANTLEHLALMYFNWGRTGESLSLYEEVKRLSANTTDTLVRYAKVLSNSGLTNKAEIMLNQVMQRDPENIEALITKASIACNTHNQTQGIAMFNQAFSQMQRVGHTVTEDALFIRGNCYRALERYDEALLDFNAILQTNPGHSGAHSNAGTIYHLQGNINKAMEHYKAAHHLNPSNKIVQTNIEKLNRLLRKSKTGT